jgi:hypothetical protein
VELSDMDRRRFWSKVEKRGDECWPWKAGVFADTGYGAFWLSTRQQNVGAHRVAALLTLGPGDGFVLHSCDNPPCCNPAHLRYGTPADNMADRSDRGRAPAGERHPNAKLTQAQVDAIRLERNAGDTLREIAERYGVTLQNIHYITSGERWTS